MYDVIVIGAGPAGISASLYLKRANINVLIISKGYGALEKAHKIENYYGLEKNISGKDLFNIGINQAKNIGIEIIEDEVTGISLENNYVFTVTTINRQYTAKKVILATGTNRKVPHIKGIKEYEGKGISYCAICDAFFYRGKDVGVLGSGNYALHEASQLKPLVNSVTIFTNGEEIVENRDGEEFEIENKPIKEFRGNKVIEEIQFEDSDIRKINGMFIAIGTASCNDLARKIGAVIQNNNIKVNENMQTTVNNLYACGDCTGGLLQVSKSVYEGAKAAVHIISNKNN